MSKENVMKMTVLGVSVKILTSERYNNRYEGLIGVIENTNTSNGDTTYGIKLPERENPKSANGWFWFAENEVEFIESEECVMLNPNENFLVAGVKFLDGNNGKVYDYALFDEFRIGDIVVVQTGHHGLALAEIVDITDDNQHRVKCSREVVCRVDMCAFYERQDKRNALAQLKKDMDKKVQELQETALYEMLAEKDPSLAAMLAEYKRLNGGV